MDWFLYDRDLRQERQLNALIFELHCNNSKSTFFHEKSWPNTDLVEFITLSLIKHFKRLSYEIRKLKKTLKACGCILLNDLTEIISKSYVSLYLEHTRS